jgi:hypothetical protein
MDTSGFLHPRGALAAAELAATQAAAARYMRQVCPYPKTRPYV